MNDEHPATPLSANAPRSFADRVAEPINRFAELEVSSAVVLVAMTVLALAWANSPWSESYFHFWHLPLAITLGDFFALELGLGHWVNDGLMAIFFFVVGMEIKREIVDGELSNRARALLPVLGALGGMVVPAGIYAFFHLGEPTIRGWGIPMATDIAFAVAALSLLGKRVPRGLRVFLLALAIADDLGAVGVIAVFYTETIHLDSLGMAGLGLALCLILNRAGFTSLLFYLPLGVFVWYETHHSGVHATIAGVLLGFATPAQVAARDPESLVERARRAVEHMREVLVVHFDTGSEQGDHGGHERHHVLQELEGVGRQALSPIDLLTNRLEPWVAYLIMPVFALANAGVQVEAAILADPVAQRVAVAVALGLVVGKPVGIAVFSWVAVRTGVARLPSGVNWSALVATGMLAGIGFTVALFVTVLAFDEAVPISGAKIGILSGSLAATLIGLAILVRALPERPADTL